MQAGRLDRRITLQRSDIATVAATDGEPIDDWTDVATVWASKRDVRGNEAFAGAERFAEVTTQFSIRGRNDIEPRWRIKYGSRLYDIVQIITIGRGDEHGFPPPRMDLLATARAEPDPEI